MALYWQCFVNASVWQCFINAFYSHLLSFQKKYNGRLKASLCSSLTCLYLCTISSTLTSWPEQNQSVVGISWRHILTKCQPSRRGGGGVSYLKMMVGLLFLWYSIPEVWWYCFSCKLVPYNVCYCIILTVYWNINTYKCTFDIYTI